MLFNSFDFGVFLPLVFFIYWSGSRWLGTSYQNLVLLIASYYFYSTWNFELLFILVFSSTLDFWIGKRIEASGNQKSRKMLLVSSIILNLSVLFVFKHFNFYINSFIQSFNFFGYTFNESSLRIVVPVGISFYTLQTMSYSIDVFRKVIPSEHNYLKFLTYVSFFPQLIAGPIERAGDFLPQLNKKRRFSFEHGTDGIRQFTVGLFKKVVIADRCGVYMQKFQNDYASFDSLSIWAVAFIGVIRVYMDFSGYSDMAIGIARLFGINLSKNFDFPFFARGIQDFWKRWHITLYQWFKDYIGPVIKGRSRIRIFYKICLIFILSGFWHGANLNFILWGLLCSLTFIPTIVYLGRRKVGFPWTKYFAPILTVIVFAVVGVSYAIRDLQHSIVVWEKMFAIDFDGNQLFPSKRLLALIIGFFILERLSLTKNHVLTINPLNRGYLSNTLLILLITIMFYFGGPGGDYEYHQF